MMDVRPKLTCVNPTPPGVVATIAPNNCETMHDQSCTIGDGGDGVDVSEWGCNNTPHMKCRKMRMCNGIGICAPEACKISGLSLWNVASTWDAKSSVWR